VNEMIKQKPGLESRTEQIIRNELVSTFMKHIEDLLGMIIRGNILELRKALDVEEEESGGSTEYTEQVIEVLKEVRENYDRVSKDELESIATTIIHVLYRCEKIDSTTSGTAELCS